jgi:hypothetical protein
MMNNEMTMTASGVKTAQVMKMVAMAINRPLNVLSLYYGNVLGRKMSIKQTLCLLNAQVAFIMAVFPACSLFLRVLFVVWLVTAVMKCREMLRTSC